MDNKDYRYDIVLDMIEHPRKYTSAQLEEILSDPETREIYNILCKSESAIISDKTVNVDTEWENFARKNNLYKRHNFVWRGSRAASIALIVFTSIAAIAAGIAITVAVNNHDQKTAVEMTSRATNRSTDKPEASMTEPQDSIMQATTPIMFEDNSLEDIIKVIAATYGLDYAFNNKEAATLHLYYRLDPSLSIDDIISQLNMFEQINIKLLGNTLTID